MQEADWRAMKPSPQPRRTRTPVPSPGPGRTRPGRGGAAGLRSGTCFQLSSPLSKESFMTMQPQQADGQIASGRVLPAFHKLNHRENHQQ